MQPLGRPVVPEVNAISATSSAAVSTAAVRRRPGAGEPQQVVGRVTAVRA